VIIPFPVYELREDKKLLLAVRECQTESGPIDALAVDQDGDIYVVETKLYRNPDKRTVVGATSRLRSIALAARRFQ
jgi:hypothetical protein